MPIKRTLLALGCIIITSLGYCVDTSTETVKSKPESVSRIKELSGQVMIDAEAQITGPLLEDKYIEFIGISTPTAPSANHARVWLNNVSRKLCTEFDDGSVRCL